MGNLSSLSVLEDDSVDEEDVENRLIRVQPKSNIQMKASISYGADIVSESDLLQNKLMDTTRLNMLHKYLTYNSPLHKMDAEKDILAYISFIISEYAEIKYSINTTLQFKAIIKSTDINTNLIRPHIFENMLCAASWNGMIYLINPLNHNKLNSHIYTINDGYHSTNLQQRMLCEIRASSKILLDPNLCCSVSHIVNRKQRNNENRFCPSSSMIIDGLIFCNSELNIVYGYSIISGLYQIHKFKKLQSHNDIERYEVVINLWRQNIDCFILTSKFNLFGIKITHKTFHIAKICSFTEAVEDIGDIQNSVDYVDCWYDINTKSLFLIYKDIQRKSVYFKIYKPDKNNGIQEDDDLDDLGIGNIEVEYETPREDQQILYNIVMIKELKQLLDDYYFLSGKSFLFYHRVSKCLLLIFNGFIIQFAINFNNKKIERLNVAVIGNYNDVCGDCDDNLNICDRIIGYDEFRSCLILNLKECNKEINLVYAFKIFVVRVMDVACDWKKVM